MMWGPNKQLKPLKNLEVVFLPSLATREDGLSLALVGVEMVIIGVEMVGLIEGKKLELIDLKDSLWSKDEPLKKIKFVISTLL